MYSRKDAIEYAKEWWNGRNPVYHNFDDLGGDCTNFVSQCLFAGVIPMNVKQYGWFYYSLNYRAPSWTGVDEFFSFAITNKDYVGVRAKICDLYQIEIGDVVQLKLTDEREFHHSLIITKIDSFDFSDIFVTGHSNDVYNRRLSSYSIKDFRFLKILN